MTKERANCARVKTKTKKQKKLFRVCILLCISKLPYERQKAFREILLEIACFCTKTYLRIEFSEKIREAGL